MRMIDINNRMCQYTEVVSLTNKIHMEDGWVTELNVADNLFVHRMRHRAYRQMSDCDGEAAMEIFLRGTLEKVHQSYSNHDGMLINDMSTDVLYEYGRVNHTLGEYVTALKSFELALKAYERSKKTNFLDCFTIQYWTATTYETLGRYHEARVLYETLLAKEQSILGPDHRLTRSTTNSLDYLIFTHFELDNVESNNARNDDNGHSGSLFDDAAIVGDELDNDESVIDEPDHDTRRRTTKTPAQKTASLDPQIESSASDPFDTLPGHNSESELGPSGKYAQGPLP